MEQLRIAEAIEKKDDLGRKHVLITQMHLESLSRDAKSENPVSH